MRYRNAQLNKYRGRFAPSPTGPLHYGSLVTAVASYLRARQQGGEWLVRIEDIDPEREPKGTIQSILQTLTDYGFKWDKKPIFQQQRHNLHKHIAQQLLKDNLAYRCSCSRKDLSENSTQGPMGRIYPGTCAKKSTYTEKHTLRIHTSNTSITFIDKHYGAQSCNLEHESGDYVIYRANELPSYILAVSVDDLFEGYSEVLRGSDLLAITPRQVHLTQLLRGVLPDFFHIPIITDQSGCKLSKQAFAPALRKHEARGNLFFALQDLGQEPPRHLIWRPLGSIWEWAFTHWEVKRIPQQHKIEYNH